MSGSREAEKQKELKDETEAEQIAMITAAIIVGEAGRIPAESTLLGGPVALLYLGERLGKLGLRESGLGVV